MTTRKKIVKAENEKQNEEITISKSNCSLIFISHDTRDAELAEEFSNLLKSASAGALKSFVSSDKKGTRGIEYGLDWYPAIMEKIDEATEVVCLLTQQSVERPWILYEAGVAKGKLDKKVIGIALGIDNRVAFTGPFAQFQNNDGSVESITKLVLDLVRKVPGLDPDQKLVEQLVEIFTKKVKSILEKNQKQPANNTEEKNENIVVKLFEEIKMMFENLPSRFENRIEPDFRRRKKFHPIMFDEIINMTRNIKDPNLAILIIISIFKDDFPWLYEIGLETYNGLKTAKSSKEKYKYIDILTNAFDLLQHPIMREFFDKSEEMTMYYKKASHTIPKIIVRLINEENNNELPKTEF
jgi:hypothetical protein